MIDHKDNNTSALQQEQQEEDIRDSNSQRQAKRKRTRKDSGVERQFVCPCQRTYLSYPALYTHIKQKHNGEAPGEILKPSKNINAVKLPSNSQSDQSSESPISSIIEEIKAFDIYSVPYAIKIDSISQSDARRLTKHEVKILQVWEIASDFLSKENFKSKYMDLLLNQYGGQPTFKISQLTYNSDTKLYSSSINQSLVLFIGDVDAILCPFQFQTLCLFSFLFRKAVNEIYEESYQGEEPCEQKQTTDISEISNFFITVLLPQYLHQLQITLRSTLIYLKMFQIPTIKDILIQLTLLYNNWLYSRDLTHHILKFKEK